MLTTLSVQNFALFDNLIVDFTEGFNVLTGETGAGKSILIDAFNIVLGDKASTDFIRTGSDFLVVQAVFDIEKIIDVQKVLDELLIEYPDNELILSRKIALNGKNISTANGIRIPASSLKIIGEMLVDVHGQYENQQLLKIDTHITLLDNFLEPKEQDLLAEYENIYNDLKQVDKQLKQNQQDASERERNLDMLDWQIKEITNASLKEGEEQVLEEQSKKLVNSEKITTALSSAYNLIDGDQKDFEGVLASISNIRKYLDVAAGYDNTLQQSAKNMQEMEYLISDVKEAVADYLQDYDAGAGELEKVQQRLDLIYKLKIKYGADVTEILHYCKDAEQKYQDLLNAEQNNQLLNDKREKLYSLAVQKVGQITKCRQKAATDFAKRVLAHICDLAMQKAKFSVDIQAKQDLSKDGQDKVQFLFSANAGQELKPLSKVASGGELSRIALCIKTVLLGKATLPTMVFDEVDTGIGGAVAQKMAEKIAIISMQKQVLCITHLPQIACMADNHIYIEKEQTNTKTTIKVKALDDNARIDEITRMITGDNQTQIAKSNAKQMIDLADARKKELRDN